MITWLLFVVAALSGALGVLAYSPFDYWVVAYVSMFALVWIIVKTRQKSTALWGAFFWSMGYFCVGVSWLNVSIHQFGGAPLWLSYLMVGVLSAYLSLYLVLFAYLIRRFQIKSAVIFAVVWTFTEFLRGWVFTGFPWLQWGYTQMDSPIAGLAPIFGVSGLTFFVVWASAVIFEFVFSLLKRERKWLINIAQLVLFLIVGTAAYYSGQVQFVKTMPERAINITLAQGNIEQNLKWDPEYLQSTIEIYQRQIAENLGKTDLIILPESALPVVENQIQPFFTALDQAARKAQTQVMIGTVFFDEYSGKLLNSIVITGDENSPYQIDTPHRYAKHHLVPFGEYVPLEKILRPLNSVFNLPMSAFESGALVQPNLNAKGRRFLPAICYEIIFGEQLRQNLRQETDYILTVSNDAWFGDSIGPWQHLQMARMRALELGKPVIRATNTGITVFIDAQGKILAQSSQFVENTLNYKLAPTSGNTPYGAFGNLPLYFLSVLLLFSRLLMTTLNKRMAEPLSKR